MSGYSNENHWLLIIQEELIKAGVQTAPETPLRAPADAGSTSARLKASCTASALAALSGLVRLWCVLGVLVP